MARDNPALVPPPREHAGANRAHTFGTVGRTSLDTPDQLRTPLEGRYGVVAGHFCPANTNTAMPTSTAGPLVAKLVTANHIEECTPSDEDEEYRAAYPDVEGADEEDEIHHQWRVGIRADGEFLYLEYSSCLRTWRVEDGPSSQETWNRLESRYGESSLRRAINEALDSPLWPGCNYEIL